MVSHSDEAAAGQGEEDIDFAFCQRLLHPVSAPRCVGSRRTQQAADLAGGWAAHIEDTAGRRSGDTWPPLAHRGSLRQLSMVVPGGTSLFRRTS
ncbi:hypothetical protein AAur_pTC20140 (plasmid) [Paenarthrobacter aurescens TC1]|uniref:Uncharacterized protein n=1 Tax=Paenarthrobacter aurescens (strain TC1) TaxID=290340 RepID=A1RDI6_PAEAT|nr:hypothetical protein AAur_pTC20140 [Paenarthrobacter aurescens TC1]